MRVVVFDPFLSAERAADLSIEKVEFEALLARADVISIHAPLTDGTRDLLVPTFSRMKDGVRIVNCARGGILVEAIYATPPKAVKSPAPRLTCSPKNRQMRIFCSACRK